MSRISNSYVQEQDSWCLMVECSLSFSVNLRSSNHEKWYEIYFRKWVNPLNRWRVSVSILARNCCDVELEHVLHPRLNAELREPPRRGLPLGLEPRHRRRPHSRLRRRSRLEVKLDKLWLTKLNWIIITWSNLIDWPRCLSKISRSHWCESCVLV